MNIELIDVSEHSEKEVIAEINKIVPILIERYNDEVGQGWDEDDKTYTNNKAMDEDEGDEYSLTNEVSVSYIDEELSDEVDGSKWSNTWTFDSDESWTIEYNAIVEDGDDISSESNVHGDYEVAYWWVISAYEQNWIPTDKT
ncbi:hypothetical protein HOB87_10525 [Candidatus Woesearchaeota archaeon]|jgi:hypothetical protein|nr:hypothetical protein [Candidatus Woesearchaeota archaeon]